MGEELTGALPEGTEPAVETPDYGYDQLLALQELQGGVAQLGYQLQVTNGLLGITIALIIFLLAFASARWVARLIGNILQHIF